MLRVRVQRACSEEALPSDEAFSTWVAAALSDLDHPAEVSLRLVDEPESRQLNAQYRQQDKPTNVLSFPAESDDMLKKLMAEAGEPLPLGDLVICVPVVHREAEEQGKAVQEHWVHMVIHGTLHLVGFDHQLPLDAERMEARERRIMDVLGFPDPYREN